MGPGQRNTQRETREQTCCVRDPLRSTPAAPLFVATVHLDCFYSSPPLGRSSTESGQNNSPLMREKR